jgi:arylsulfatase A-like enzyme
MKGRNLNGLVDGSGRDEWPDDVYIQISESHCGRAVRTRKWKYSVRAPDAQRKAGFSDTYVEDFLYDLEKDPHERNNLVSDPKLDKVREEMKQRLLKHMEHANEPRAEITSRQQSPA